MFAAFVILVIGLMPSVVSLWVMRRSEERMQARLALTMEAVANHGLSRLRLPNPDQNYIDGLGYIVGDITCQFNARSPYLRCAVNPSGPCEACRHYQSKEYSDPFSQFG
jgi:hypothetical protein